MSNKDASDLKASETSEDSGTEKSSDSKPTQNGPSETQSDARVESAKHSKTETGSESASVSEAKPEPEPERSSSAGSSADARTNESGADGSGRKGGGLAILALLLALTALAASGWLYVDARSQPDGEEAPRVQALADRQSRFETEIADLGERIDRVVATQNTLEQGLASSQLETERLAALEEEQARLQNALDGLTATLSEDDPIDAAFEDQVESVERLESRIVEIGEGLGDLRATQSALESRIASISESLREQQGLQREVDRDLALKLDLLEVGALVALGQARIELVEDRAGALRAYEQANRQLAALDDRRLDQARERLAEEMARIESWSAPDWSRQAARLAQWEEEAASWPLRATSDARPVSAANSDNEADDGWLSSMGQSLGRLVTVERLDGLALSEDQVVAIREQLQLQLAAAGLAVQRRELDLLQLRLEDAGNLLDDFFQVDDERLREVRAELDALATMDAPEPPDGLGQAASAIDRALDTL